MNYEQKCKTGIEIPFGAKDSELKGWEYTIPEGMEAIIKDGKVIVKEKKSEDEKIRKFLIEILSHGTWRKEWPFGPNEVVAYLEKQKEQPKEELVYRLNGFMQEYIKEGKDEAEKEHRFKCYQLFWDALEDENFFEQKEQKPAKWSEKDEEKMNSISEIIEHCVIIPYSGGKLTASKEYKKELQCFLKSLRPSWKPSEEQIRAVFDASERNDKLGSVLRNLYDDLKKLM